MAGELFVNGEWIQARGESFESTDPAGEQVNWRGRAATAADVDTAVSAARRAAGDWAALTFDDRKRAVEAYGKILEDRAEDLARIISAEVGKPLWESRLEVGAMIGKVPISLQAHHDRRTEQRLELGGAIGATRYKPHGVVAVFGPFNLPGHVPNGHIVPALLEGNTIVFKPSEQVPAVGQLIAEMMQDAKLPPGVFNLVQGARDIGVALVNHTGLDGVYFTGSLAVGCAIARALADRPQTILALELGGNNPLLVHEVSDLKAAAYVAVQSGYITSGQRCTCAQRLILPAGGPGDRFIEQLLAMIDRIRIGPASQIPEPFMGPVISAAYADKLLAAQQNLIERGGKVILEMKRIDELGPAFLSPGLIDMTDAERDDEEMFGPILQVIRTDTFADAVMEANRTQYGLAAALLSDRRENWDKFVREIRAGVVNWNRPTSGASSNLPFGGAGASGNHRPAGYWSVEYCSYPMATIEVDRLTLPAKPTPGIEMENRV